MEINGGQNNGSFRNSRETIDSEILEEAKAKLKITMVDLHCEKKMKAEKTLKALLDKYSLSADVVLAMVRKELDEIRKIQGPAEVAEPLNENSLKSVASWAEDQRSRQQNNLPLCPDDLEVLRGNNIPPEEVHVWLGASYQLDDPIKLITPNAVYVEKAYSSKTDHGYTAINRDILEKAGITDKELVIGKPVPTFSVNADTLEKARITDKGPDVGEPMPKPSVPIRSKSR